MPNPFDSPRPDFPPRWNRRRLAAAVAVFMSIAGLITSLAPAQENSAYLGRGMPYAAFDRLKTTPVTVGKSVIDVAFAPGQLSLTEPQIIDLVASSARIVAGYYGRFPVDHARLLVVPVEGTTIHGTTYAYRGAAIRFVLGREVTLERATRDWVLIHEMTHLAFPEVRERHHWIEEGLATYVEPIARVQAGQIPVDNVWRDMARGLPQGLPNEGDRGLDNTPTWGRIYWGGALFCLLAEIEIRSRTDNRVGLQHALRAIRKASGGMEVTYVLSDALKIGDAAIGQPVLSELYGRMKDAPMDVDLDALWRQLGVHIKDRAVTYDDSAPLAAIRRAITAPPTSIE